MGRCVIFCAGGFAGLIDELRGDDYIIAADGGLSHVRALGLTPHLVLGDFDSLGFVPEGSERHPVEKDDTDAMLAVKRGLALGFTDFLLYGSLDGPRLDHTVANFQTLGYLCAHGARGVLIGETALATAAEGETLRFPANADGYISVFAMGGSAQVSLKKLYYSLEHGVLSPDFPLGVSNRFTGKPAEICAECGRILVIFDRSAGLPVRV